MTPPGPRVCAVVLNWNQAALTLRCAATLLAQDAAGVDLDILVVDNGSAPADAGVLGAGLPAGCRLVRNARNLGFAGGMNVGIRDALGRRADYIWLMNNDAFPDPDCLARLVGAMAADPTLAAVTPRLTYPDGSAQTFAGRFDCETGALEPVSAGPIPRPTPAGWFVVGAALLVRAAAVRAVGGFDTRFFAYFEETDLCARLTRRGRWNLGAVEGAGCVHLERATAGVASPLFLHLMTRNALLFARKHRPGLGWVRPWLRQAALQLVHAGALDRAGHPAQASAVVAALWAAGTNAFYRPRRLTAPAAAERFLLGHYWGVARRLWGAANLLAPAGRQRPPLADVLRPAGGGGGRGGRTGGGEGMSDATGRVTVVIPSYNAATFLGDTIRCALGQTRPPAEVVVVDDGSTDGTAAVAAAFGPPVRVIRQANAGPSAARNAGTRAATGDWVAFLDADDVWAPDRLERILAHPAAADPAVVALFNELEYLYPDGTREPRPSRAALLAGEYHIDLMRDWLANPSCVVARAAAARAVPFPEGVNQGEDQQWIVLLRGRGPLAHVPEVLTGYRRRPAQLTSDPRHTLIGIRHHLDFLASHPDLYPPADADRLRAWFGGVIVENHETAYWQRNAAVVRECRELYPRVHPTPDPHPRLFAARLYPRWAWRVKDWADRVFLNRGPARPGTPGAATPGGQS